MYTVLLGTQISLSILPHSLVNCEEKKDTT